jgi:5'(3')-deoxyribonucleotidase
VRRSKKKKRMQKRDKTLPNLAIDVDGTILNYKDEILKILKDFKIKDLKPDEYFLGMEKGNRGNFRKNIIKLFNKSPAFSLIPEYVDAFDSIKELSKHYNIYIISHCPKHLRNKRLSNLLPIIPYICEYESLTKKEIKEKQKDKIKNVKIFLSDKVKASIVIEDGPTNIPKLCDAGKTVYYLEHGYNKNIDSRATAFSSWKELLKIILNKI